jgi:putative hydrolase of the HAD superfamily
LIKLIIFDLDNTLFDTYGQLGTKIIGEMILRMKRAGLTKRQEDVLRKKYPFTGFRILAEELKLPERIRQIGMSAYEEMDISNIKPFFDVMVLGKIGYEKSLVTSGSKAIQLKKVDVLGIKHYFDDIVVDESNSNDGRKTIFSELAVQHKAKPGQVIVIGDNPEIELAAGKKLGMLTVQITRRDNVLKGEADHHVKNLYEFEELLKRIG